MKTVGSVIKDLSLIDQELSIETNKCIIIEDNIKKQLLYPTNIIGNHCGHNPHDPKLFVRPISNKGLPPILRQTMAILNSAYKKPKKFLKDLCSINKSGRQKRTERRESIISLCCAMVNYVDLATLRVGMIKSSYNFTSPSLKYLAEKSKISMFRAKRALSDLVKAGYIECEKQFILNEKGNFIPIPSIKKITIKFFSDLAIDVQRLIVSRDWKRKKIDKETFGNKKSFGRNLINSFSSLVKKPSSINNKNKPNVSAQKEHELIATSLSLYKSDPSRSCGDYYKELKSRLAT